MITLADTFIEEFDKTDEYPYCARVHYDKGLSFAGRKRYPEAVDCFRNVLSTMPPEHDYAVKARYRLAVNLLNTGDYRDAEEEFKKVMDLINNMPLQKQREHAHEEENSRKNIEIINGIIRGKASSTFQENDFSSCS